MLSQYMLAHVCLHFATILAIRTLKTWLEAALVSEMPVQISFPIERPVAIRARTDVNGARRFLALGRSSSLAVRPPARLQV